jgi:hypothetical protein
MGSNFLLIRKQACAKQSVSLNENPHHHHQIRKQACAKQADN